MKLKTVSVLACLLLFTILAASHARAGWLIYHKPAFKGKVIDAETKEPIEGAVVVVSYSKNVMLPPESYSTVVNVRETLTDENGEFYIPPYTTVIHPLSTEEWARFIIYKPGYGSYPNYQVSPPKLGVSPEEFFSREETGTEGEMLWQSRKIKVTFGIVELPKLKTKEERLKAMPGSPAGYTSKELPLLYKTFNEENKRFGLGEEK